MSPSQVLKKPRLVVMGSREYAVDDYVADFEKDFEFTVRGCCLLPSAASRSPSDFATCNVATVIEGHWTDGRMAVAPSANGRKPS